MSFWRKLFGKSGRKESSGKLKLYSMRKVDDKSIFKIEKRQSFMRHFRALLKNLDFSDVETWHHDPTLNKEFPVARLVNFCDTFKNKSFEIEIVFTHDREVVIVKSSDANRRKFVEELMKFCEWNEPKRRIQPLVRQNF